MVATGGEGEVRDELAPLNILHRCQSCGEDHEWIIDEAAITVWTEALTAG